VSRAAGTSERTCRHERPPLVTVVRPESGPPTSGRPMWEDNAHG
jgi:hypothetical protein